MVKDHTVPKKNLLRHQVYFNSAVEDRIAFKEYGLGLSEAVRVKAMNGNSNCRMWVVTERDWTAFRIEFRTANPISFKSAMKSFFSNQSGINMVTNQPKNVYLYSISA